MDLELREGLAFGDDRGAALAQLLPGSADHDYYRCLQAQHAGRLDEADAIIAQWDARHGRDARARRLEMRQWLYRSQQNLSLVADKLRDWLGVSHWHEREVEESEVTRESVLPEGTFDGQTLLARAIEQDSHLGQVTDEGLLRLLDSPNIDSTRLRALLQRLTHTAHDQLVPRLAQELQLNSSGGFGSLPIHAALTLAQLHALAETRPELRSNMTWVSAVVARLRPARDVVDLEVDITARLAFLDEVWRFLAPLPEAINSLKVHVMWHVLDTRRHLGLPVNIAQLATYLALPRHASYGRDPKKDRPSYEFASIGADFSGVTGLPPARDDEGLVRALIQEIPDRALELETWLERHWLDDQIAIGRLLSGAGDIESAAQRLGASRAAELRERIDLAWCLHCPTLFGADDNVVLEADVKNVPELVVKVFRVDPHAYFVHTKRIVGPDLDLDGLAATSEQVLRIVEPPVRRLRKRIELPACARPGTYVVDIIGSGKSSRAVIHKGRLRYTSRISASGLVVTVVDGAGRARPDARAIVGEREYTPDERGSFVIPFSTSPSRVPMLLFAGDLATVVNIDLERETPTLSTTLHLDREGLSAGRTARAVLRARLAIGGAPASVSLIKRAMWDVALTDRAGVVTTKTQTLALSDGDATVLEFPLGEDTSSVLLTVRGHVEIRSEQREEEVRATHAVGFGGIHATDNVESLFLAHTARGWVLSALGKNGEPRANRPVTVGLTHRWSRVELDVSLGTDARGRVELGELPGVTRIVASLGDQSRVWDVSAAAHVTAAQVFEDHDVVLAVPPRFPIRELAQRLSIVEQRNGTNVRHPGVSIDETASGIAIRGLPVGVYEARAPGFVANIAVLPPCPVVAGTAFTPTQVADLSWPEPVIQSFDTQDGLRVVVRNATEATRVHVLVSTFAPALVQLPRIGTPRALSRRMDHPRGVDYVSGRELGDEYRYVLDRRRARRFPGLLLDRPSLLLNPWARRTTSTAVANAALGGAFGAAPARMEAEEAYDGYGGGGGHDGADEHASYDFLATPPAVLVNLVPDENGVVTLSAAGLGNATSAAIIVEDPAGTTVAYARFEERALATRDRRLVLALDPATPATQRKQITPLGQGATLVIENLATAKVHLLDTLEKAHGYLLALRDDATLREFGFITRWPTTPDAERRELYSKYACHELHLFLWAKDRTFFDAVVKPYLAHKRTKTFVDHFLLDDDLTSYLEPAKLATLSAVERALLGRKVFAGPAMARLLADEVAVLPPDPTRDAHIIDALLGSATLDTDSPLGDLAQAAYDDSFAEAAPMMERSRSAPRAGGGPGGAPMMAMAASPAMAPPSPPRPSPKAAKKEARRSMARDEMAEDERRYQAAPPPPMYRVVDKTQEWAENNWWHRTPAQSGAAMITPNRFWRDLALHASGPFLSPSLGLAIGSFAEAMCALAVIDLPFVAGAHTMTAQGPRLEIVAASPALAGSSQLVPGELVVGGAPLVIGMSFVRTDDRYDYVNGEQVDKYVDGPFATGVVYTCQVVVANPTSARQRISALVQIPRGSIPVLSGVATTTLDVHLGPYGTHGHEVAFYFPEPGVWSHFPVHASRGDQIVAAAPARALEVTSGAIAADPRSWSYISQHGTLADVVAFLGAANLGAIDISRVAWRCREREGYEAITSALEKRTAFDATIWGYAIRHLDAPRVRAFLRSRAPLVGDLGPVLEMIDLDGEDLGTYEHLEYAPLVNARAHRLGAKTKILNNGLSGQYDKFLDLVAHRPVPLARDLVAATHYLFAQDRIELALDTLGRVDPTRLAERMPYAYVAAYAACILGDTARARAFATPYRDHLVDRWRHRFAALLAMLDELEGAGTAIVDTRSREQQLADQAAAQPTFSIALDREGITITSQNVPALELRFFEMDVELLFSRQPFVRSDVSRFSFIEPGHRQQLAALPPELRVPWPEALRGRNVVVEAVGVGHREAAVHYANDLAVNVARTTGRLRVTRASDARGLAATYVKVFAKKRDQSTTFFKDGYTDLRGWFDYASLSTDELDHVERFAILVCDDQAGALILEAAPPQR